MNTRRVLYIFLSIFSLCILQPATAHALDMSAGAAAWYAWWAPGWAESNAQGKPEFKVDPAILVGPVLSFVFADGWSLSAVFMIGKYKGTAENPADPANPSSGTFSFERDIMKYDLDTTLNYSITKIFKIFAGIKYQSYNYKDEANLHIVYPSLPPVTMDMKLEGKSDYKSYGPGLGIGITYPVIQSLYVLLNVSGIALQGEDDQTLEMPIASTGTTIETADFETKQKFTTYGFNGSIALAYYIAGANTTVSLGFRYQYLKYKVDEGDIEVSGGDPANSEKEPLFNYDGTKDKFYGITLSAIYSFDI